MVGLVTIQRIVTRWREVNGLSCVVAKISDSMADCPVARTLDLIGDRWTILLLRDLLLHGARRFSDFEASLVGVAPTTLSARLKRLEANGVVERAIYNEHPPRLEYKLTEKGRSLGPIVAAMRNWGAKQGG